VLLDGDNAHPDSSSAFPTPAVRLDRQTPSVLNAIERLVGAELNEEIDLAWWHGYWREVIDANLDAQAYWIATPSGTITDRKLMYAWLYGDVIHARSPRSPVIRDLDIDQRYCAAAPGIARICDRVIYTQIMVEGLIDKGLLTVDPPRHRDRPDRGH
jgi:hypothetical protein